MRPHNQPIGAPRLTTEVQRLQLRLLYRLGTRMGLAGIGRKYKGKLINIENQH